MPGGTCVSVEYKGRIYRVKNNMGTLSLNLAKKNISDITDIKGLGDQPQLHFLNLSHNNITEINGLDDLRSLVDLNLNHNHIRLISGLDYLVNLGKLDLANNDIIELSGLENLQKLRYLFLTGNPVHDWAVHTLGKFDYIFNVEPNPQAAVVYCRERKQKETGLPPAISITNPTLLPIKKITRLEKLFRIAPRARIDDVITILGINRAELLDVLIDSEGFIGDLQLRWGFHRH